MMLSASIEEEESPSTTAETMKKSSMPSYSIGRFGTKTPRA